MLRNLSKDQFDGVNDVTYDSDRTDKYFLKKSSTASNRYSI